MADVEMIELGAQAQDIADKNCDLALADLMNQVARVMELLHPILRRRSAKVSDLSNLMKGRDFRRPEELAEVCKNDKLIGKIIGRMEGKADRETLEYALLTLADKAKRAAETQGSAQ